MDIQVEELNGAGGTVPPLPQLGIPSSQYFTCSVTQKLFESHTFDDGFIM